MKQFLATVTSNGRVTIPAEVRRHLSLQTPGKIAFIIGSDGTVQVRAPGGSIIAALRGAAGALEKPLSWQEVRVIAREDRLSAKG